MNKQRKPIKVHLQTVIIDQGQREVYTIEGEGELISRDSITALSFTEENVEEGEVKHFISIHPNRVNIKRKGQIETNQQFLLHKWTENRVELVSGNILIDIYTEELSYESESAGNRGKLRILYEALLNGQIERKHEITLIYTKEDVE